MKQALVTGASGDIGSAVARRLAAQGLKVILHGHTRGDRLESLADEIRGAGGSAEAVLFDVRDPTACAGHLGALAEQGPIQVLINNAGVHSDAPMAGMEPEQWRDVIDVSLHGFFNVTQPILLPMIRTRWGRIVSISSVAGLVGNRGQSNYAAAKAGLQGASKALALELASRGVTVNVVAPGIIAGRLTEDAFNNDTIKRLVPMQRAGTPAEVASLVGYLVSDEAAYISGQVISVNGAMA